jgi:NADPH:quinone reductase-like Zn-dependent oxidoreductase
MSWPTNAVTRGGERYDLVFDVVGNHPFSAYRRVLATDGTYVLIGHDQVRDPGPAVVGQHPGDVLADGPLDR